ncbi:MAG: glycosyltransferase family 4 protein, partial [Actinomycetota bacterium]|nr:glycosyltransferase family 4 protein [Actinomycetota bacterium]
MRIVHVADSFAPDVGGIERQVETLVRHQMAQGHDVTVITAVAESAELDGELDVARSAKGRWLTVAFPWRNRRMVANVLDGRPIDVVHAHFTVISPMAIYVTRAAGRRGIPVAATVHSLWWQVAAATRISTLPFGWGRMRAAWSGVSSVAAGHVRRTLRSVQQVSVVPNLVDAQWWRAGMPQQREASDTIRMVLVGRLKKRKHVDEFIDVLAQVRQRVPGGTKVSVNIVGEGPRRADLQQQIDTLGLTDWVSLLGHRDSAGVRELHHRSELFIASSRQESFGIAAFEARAAGLPVIGYRGNGLADYIANGSDGILVTDREEMVQALVALIQNPDELRRLLENTTTEPPSITPEYATRAVEDLYA